MEAFMIRKSRGKAEVSLPPQEADPSWLNECFADFFDPVFGPIISITTRHPFAASDRKP